MKKKILDIINRNRIRHDLRKKIREEKKLDRQARSMGNLDVGDKIDDSIPCVNCLGMFVKIFPRQKFCSMKCRRKFWTRRRARKKLRGRIETESIPIRVCKRCYHFFELNLKKPNQEYCEECSKIMKTSKGRREHEEEVLEEMVEEKLREEEGEKE